MLTHSWIMIHNTKINFIVKKKPNDICTNVFGIHVGHCRANTYRHTTYIVDIPYSHTHTNT
jgi:hypothetical protein